MNTTDQAATQAELLLLDMTDKERYEVVIAEDGTMVALVTYRLSKQWIALLHTEVQQGFAGQGMGSRTARLVFEDARKRGLKIVPKCPFILRWLERHPEQHDVLFRPLVPPAPASDADSDSDSDSPTPLEMG